MARGKKKRFPPKRFQAPPKGHGNASYDSSAGRARNNGPGSSNVPRSLPFSLADEARLTSGHDKHWLHGTKLRNLPVSFVSAGRLAGNGPDKQADVAPDSARPSSNSSPSPVEPQESLANLTLEDDKPPVVPRSENDHVQDSDQFRGVTSQTNTSGSPLRTASPTPSSSTEEIVLFRGRNPPGSVLHPRVADPPPTSSAKALNDSKQTASSNCGKQTPGCGPPQGATSNEKPSKDKFRRQKPTKRFRRAAAATRAEQNIEDGEAHRDYVFNLGEHGFLNDSTLLRPMDGATSNELEKYLLDVEKYPEAYQDRPGRHTVFPTSLAPENLLATSRSSSDQYPELESRDSTSDDGFGAGSDDDALNDEEEDGDNENSNTDESFEDEKDIIKRRMDQLDDERIAELLAKQNFYGMGSEELLIFGADDAGDFGGPSTKLKRPSRPSQHRGNDREQHFPSATVMADVLEQDPYGGFDVMDYERPSLKNKAKGRRNPTPFELSDNELESAMKAQWELDRNKKRLKKAEREQLRAQGLLGRKNKGIADLSVKYHEGMSILDIKEEFKLFLTSTLDSRTFPPLEKNDRAFVHALAAGFGLKSKSSGKGNNRCPTLIKTTLTAEFDDVVFTRLQGRYHQGFMPRPRKAARTKRGGGTSAATYMEGEIVGHAAPEIGSENRGRAMLEKMGWSKGTALGALNNKGIMEPITHVVKTSKAGLG
ncbi:hypothetical protein BDY21DRAFT_377917 [Lineolata rhizophorae]|uniref:Protein SQS1 n=1 Tax=Lineolata rhizophorae TaxID=578093 RepID=A0A6A6P6Y8_9PEZI|nr:hypothetical protein BDY21DRAFT_377917 [Lineolata rhizophorae]